MNNTPWLAFLICFVLGCQPKTTIKGEYLGNLQLSTLSFQLYLNLNDDFYVQNVTRKAEYFELDTIYRVHDSLYFLSEDHTVAYKGKFDGAQIIGQWIIEDSIYFPLVFKPTRSDTIRGMHPRVSDYSYQEPLHSDDGIAVSALSLQSLNKDSMTQLTQRIIKRQYEDIHSLLVSRHSQLAYEEYFFNFKADHIYNIQSANKSIVSALVGIAIGKGEIKNTSEILCQYLKGYESVACNQQNKNITLSELLTMNTGIPWDEQTYDYMDERNSQSISANAKDQFVYLLSQPMSEEKTFAYNSLNHLLINAVLKNATGLDNDTELTERLLSPLGITEMYIPEQTPMGVIGDISLRPRDMLKFGLLYLNKGVWQGQQLVPENWIAESTAAKIYPTTELGYGYFWWTKEFDYHGDSVQSYFAWGYGGQYIAVVPELELVVVMSGSHWSTHPEGQGLEIIQDVINAVE